MLNTKPQFHSVDNLPRSCSLLVHTNSHSPEELIVNPELFPTCVPGGLLQIYDPDNPDNRSILRVPQSSFNPAGRLEISILKSIADSANLKQYSRVVVDHISEKEAELDFVELSFRRQYLQRGNMLRFKNYVIGRTVHLNQNMAIHSMQAQIQDLRTDSKLMTSGLITNSTKFVFRSKSSRIVWLVQISAEMWDIDTVCKS